MNSLRKAAEALLNHWDAGEFQNCTGYMAGHIRVLREALAQPDDLQTAIERGTKAWADVPNASKWVDELRGNDKPPVKTYAGGKPNYCTPEEVHETLPCKTHPDAPHGFDRNASHSADRYVCECEGWEPVDAVNMTPDRVDETAKGEHDLWIAAACLKSTVEAAIKAGDWKVDGACDPTMDLQYLANCFSSIQNREWVGLTDEDMEALFLNEDGVRFARYIEAKLKEKNS